jgi:hypothetical protein
LAISEELIPPRRRMEPILRPRKLVLFARLDDAEDVVPVPSAMGRGGTAEVGDETIVEEGEGAGGGGATEMRSHLVVVEALLALDERMGSRSSYIEKLGKTLSNSGSRRVSCESS